MSVLLLLALAATTPPVPGPLPGVVGGAAPHAAPVASGQLAWEVPLASAPAGPLRTLAVPGAETLVLLPLADRVEARSAADGSVRWSRTDLAGSGLMPGDPVALPSGPAVAWAGLTGEAGRLVIVSLATGGTVVEIPLDAKPAGAAAGVLLAAASGPRWLVPLANGRVVAFDSEGRPAGSFPFLAHVTGPVLGIAGHALVAVERAPAEDASPGPLAPSKHFDLVPLAPSAKVAAKDVEPATAVVGPDGLRLYAAGERSFGRWHCRSRSRGVACHLEWRQQLGGTVPAAPLVLADRVIVSSLDTHLYSFEAKNGHLLWRVRAGTRLSTAPLAWDAGHVAVGTEGNARILFYDVVTGEQRGTVDGGKNDVFVGGIARAGDVLVVPCFADPTYAPVLRAYTVSMKVPEPKTPPATEPPKEGQPKQESPKEPPPQEPVKGS